MCGQGTGNAVVESPHSRRSYRSCEDDPPKGLGLSGMAYAGSKSMCPDMWGLGTGTTNSASWSGIGVPLAVIQGGGLWVFGWGNQGQGVHDGHADTMRQSHASLTELAWPLGWLHLGCIQEFCQIIPSPPLSSPLFLVFHCVVSLLLWTPPELHRVCY